MEKGHSMDIANTGTVQGWGLGHCIEEHEIIGTWLHVTDANLTPLLYILLASEGEDDCSYLLPNVVSTDYS